MTQARSLIGVLATLAASALALSACNNSESGFDARVHDYILKHPEVIQKAIDELQAQQDQQAAQRAKVLIAQNRQSIEHDPRDFVANPAGRVTVTEFYDYRCPHCINIAPAVLKIIHDHPDVRFVFKEFPIFGDVSEHAAAGAIQLKNQGGDELSLYSDFMNTHPLDDAAVDRILRTHGVDPATLNTPAVRRQVSDQLQAVRTLALDRLGLEGTPAFIVGDTLVPGDDVNALNAAINQALTRSG